MLQAYRFCNVFREDDKTTAWFRRNVRNVLRNHPADVALATITFRWFNRIEIGERILDILLLEGWDARKIKSRLRGVSPIVTGAYMVKTPAGMTKLDGIAQCMRGVTHRKLLGLPSTSLEEAHAWLTQLPHQGDFTAYEVVTDLRHTKALDKASDVLTWANPGPGAARGITWLTGREYNRHSKVDRVDMMNVMRQLLELANDDRVFLWPEEWPRWELREVEHTLCEYSKYCQAKHEGKRLKRRWTP